MHIHICCTGNWAARDTYTSTDDVNQRSGHAIPMHLSPDRHSSLGGADMRVSESQAPCNIDPHSKALTGRTRTKRTPNLQKQPRMH